MRKPGELVATFDGYRQRWPRDDQITETIIGDVSESVSDGVLRHTIKGTINLDALKVGLTYRFWGRHTTHDRWGEQFHFEAFAEEQPATRAAVCLYLEQIDGIGPATAKAIWDRYGVAAVETFRERPDEIAVLCPRLTLDQCRAGADLLWKKQRTERGKMELMELVHKLGVPKRIVDKALDTWGVHAAQRIQRNPYLLMKFRGIGFLKTDRIYLDFGHNPLRLKRQALAVWYSVARDCEGHTWFPLHVARDFLRKHISSANVDFEKAMTLAERGGLITRRDFKGATHFAEKSRANAEWQIARLIEAARIESRENGTAWPDVGQIAELAGDDGFHQREELRAALCGVVSVLAGSPGTGKTFTAAALIKTIRRMYPAALVAAAAPTGKAAVRLTESLEKCGVKLAARTVHSLLGVSSSGDDGFSFQHDGRNPLPFKFVLIDEASMLDVPLMASLLAARGMGTHFLILGDPNQLAPVGHGAPLRDLLQCPNSVPYGILSEIRRNSGRGVRVCASIRDRIPWQPAPKLDLATGENLIIANAESPADQIESLSTIVRKFRDASPQKYDPVWDVQVICAVNKKGELARRTLNPLLQDLLNPDGFTVKDCPFRVGDKIVNTKNGLMKHIGEECVLSRPDPDEKREKWEQWEPGEDIPDIDENGCVYVANGEQAEVIEIEGAAITARLASPRRTVVFYRKGKSDQQKAAEDAAGGEDNENAESEATSTGCSWELGYAISAHKSQGSEWPVVIAMLDTDPAARRTCSRQWIYTAISRFKDFAVLIGTKKTADGMTRRDALFARRTFLKDRIELLKREADEAERPAVEVCEFSFDDVLEGVL